MLRKRNEYPRPITPKGVVAWASLHEPDYEYKKEGEFYVRLRLKPGDPGVDELIAVGQEILDEAFDAKKKELKKDNKGALLKQLNKQEEILSEELDRESGEPTGYLILRAGMKHKIEIKNGPKAGKTFTKVPDFFDATGKRLKKAPMVGSGSEVKLAVRVMDYWFAKDKQIGIRFELEGVQIIELAQGGERDASSYGFEEEDGAFVTEDGDFGEEDGGYVADDEDAEDDGDF